MNIAQIIKNQRQVKGITQTQLAEHLGFSNRGQVSKLENEKLEWKFKDVVKALELFGLKIEIN